MRKNILFVIIVLAVLGCTVSLSVNAESFRKYYPNGTLIRQKDSFAVWLSEGTQRHLIPSPEVFNTRFKWNNVIEVSEIPDDFEIGEEVKFSDGTLLMGDNSTVYIVTDNGYKRGFVSKEIFEGLGYKWKSIIKVSNTELAKYSDSVIEFPQMTNMQMGSVNNLNSHPMGTLINVDGTIYRKDRRTSSESVLTCDGCEPMIFRGIPSPDIFLANNFKWENVVSATEGEKSLLNSAYNFIGSNITFPDGTLLKGKSSPTVYLMEYGQKTPFHTANEFLSRGYKWESILEINDSELNMVPNGVDNWDCSSESGC